MEKKVKLVSKIDITDTLAIFRFSIPTDLSFIPGQYITLYFEDNGKKIARPYSIGSCPQDLPFIDLFIKLITEENKGAFTKKLFSCDIGTEFNILKIGGDFILDNEDSRDIIMVCSGTGVAPYISMINDRVEKIKDGKSFSNKIFLLYGASFKKDLAFNEDIQEALDFGVIKEFIPTLSREDWEGHKGRVETLFEDGTIEKLLELNKKKVVIYLCGHPGMIDNLKEFLKNKGFEDKL